MTPAGVTWCSRYPTSRSVTDLASPFREGVITFLAELASRRCTVTIAATKRPEQRAWLMRQAWDLAEGLVTLDAVPVRPDIEIEWTVAGAEAMVAAYALRYRPSLTSRHITGHAIDMTIKNWSGTGEELFALGASFGVHKLRSDPPHWSDTGG